MAEFPSEPFPLYHPNPEKEISGKTIITTKKSKLDPDSDFNAVAFGKLSGLLVGVDGQPMFRREGRGKGGIYVSYDTSCLPLAPPNTRTADDIIYDPEAAKRVSGAYITQKGVGNLLNKKPKFFKSCNPASTSAQSSSASSAEDHELQGILSTSSNIVCFIPYAVSSSSFSSSSSSCEGYLLYSSGANLSQISVTVLSSHLDSIDSIECSDRSEWSSFSSYATSKSLVRSRVLQTVDLPGRLCHLTTSFSSCSPFSSPSMVPKVLVCAVCFCEILFLEMTIVNEDQWSDHCQLLRVVAAHSTTSTVSTAASCPFFFGEAVFVTEQGGVYLWDQDAGVTTIRMPISSSSSSSMSKHHFLRCVYGPHPRCVVIAERTGVTMMEFLSSPSSTRSLLSYPSLHLPQESDVTALARHPSTSHPFSLFIATTHTILMMDVRQHHQPLLVLRYETENNVDLLYTSLSYTLSSSSSSSVLLLAVSSHTQEGVVYTISAGPTSPPQSLSPPHAVDPYREFSLKVADEYNSLHRRLSQPVAGACLVPLSSNHVACILLSTLGDVFFQCWHYTSLTSSSSSPMPTVSPSYRLWVDEAVEQESKLRLNYDSLSRLPAVALDCSLLQDYITNPLSDSGMCMKCVSVSSEGGVYSHIDPTNYMTTPLPLNGTSHQHCCTFCGERQWSVKEEEVEREVFVDEMRDRCARQESEFSEVKRLWNKWEEEEEEDEEGSDEETQTDSMLGNQTVLAATPTTVQGSPSGVMLSQHTPRSRSKIRRIGF